MRVRLSILYFAYCIGSVLINPESNCPAYCDTRSCGFQGTNMSLGSKLRENLGRRERFAFDARQSPMHFAVDHYAGRVQYHCSKILDKNRDNLSAGGVSRHDQPIQQASL